MVYIISDHRLVVNNSQYKLQKKIGKIWSKTQCFNNLSQVASKLLAQRKRQNLTDQYNLNINKALEAICTDGYIKKLERKRERLLSV